MVAAGLLGGGASADRLDGLGEAGWRDVLRSAGLLFFAFAGYARIATLGEEVRNPARTIPRATALALGAVLLVYLVVATTALATVGPAGLAGAEAPLAEVVRSGSLDGLVALVRVGGTVAALGVLVSLLAGVARTAFAMAGDGELPRALAAVHLQRRVPHVAQVTVGAAVAVLVATTDLRGSVGFSSFCVLAYYAVANAAAWTLPGRRVAGRAAAAAGLAGCAVLALTLPSSSVVAGVAVLLVGVAVRQGRRLVSGGAGSEPPAPHPSG